jgi:hypothetical protein
VACAVVVAIAVTAMLPKRRAVPVAVTRGR